MQAVIFDMDGVLIDSEPVHERIEAGMFRELGVELADGEHRSFQGTSSVEMWRAIADRYGLTESPESLSSRQRRRFLASVSAGEVPQTQGISRVLAGLRNRGVPRALASSSAGAVVRQVLEHTALADYFDVVVSGDEAAQSKPAPDIFLLASRRLGVEAGHCVVVEDSENGVRAAKAAGMICVGFRNPGSGNNALAAADYRVSSAGELEELLSRLPLEPRG